MPAVLALKLPAFFLLDDAVYLAKDAVHHFFRAGNVGMSRAAGAFNAPAVASAVLTTVYTV